MYENDQLNDGKDWLQYVTLSNFTGVQLQPNTPFILTLYLINPYTAYSLTQKTISAILYNSLGQQTSRGSVDLTSIYPALTTFTPVQLPTYTLIESTKLCSMNNTLSFNITLPINVGTQTYLYFVVPMAYYVI